MQSVKRLVWQTLHDDTNKNPQTMIYFTADLHLGHKSIIQLSNRPFFTIEEMDETLIANWNRKVNANDKVYILGDLIYKSDNPEYYLQQLHGNKILLIGNHDKSWLSKIKAENYLLKTALMLEENIGGKMVTLCHYPMLEWCNSRKSGTKKSYLIHGHIHNRQNLEFSQILNDLYMLNAGVDVNNFEPVTFSELLENNLQLKNSK